MRIESAFVESTLFISVMALLLVSCAGSGQCLTTNRREAPSLGAYPYSGRDVRNQQYGPQDRAGNQTQNGLPAYSNCQYTTRC